MSCHDCPVETTEELMVAWRSEEMRRNTLMTAAEYIFFFDDSPEASFID